MSSDQKSKDKPQPVQPPVPQHEQENLELIFKRISDDFKDVKPLIFLAAKLNLEPGQLILGLICTAFTLTIIGAGSQIVNLLIGMLYPGYMSLLAMKTKNQKDTKLWLAYWIIFLLTFLLDKIIWFLFFDFQALYHPVKTMFLIWLYYPRTQGVLIVYDKLVTQLKSLGIVEELKKEKEKVEQNPQQEEAEKEKLE